MKNKTIQKIFLAVSTIAFLFGVFPDVGINVAHAAKEKAEELGKMHGRMGIECSQCHGNLTKTEPVSMEKCVSCHDTNKLADSTSGLKPTNPHNSRHYNTEADCNLCHHMHKKSENFCLPCHKRFDFIVP
jgi:hypothetical protein